MNSIDIALVDGQKSDYLKFLNEVYPKMNDGGLVIIDNSFWKGTFLEKDLSQNNQSAKNINELHEFIQNTQKWNRCFLPFRDGIFALEKLSQ